jgi:hypothetical protein
MSTHTQITALASCPPADCYLMAAWPARAAARWNRLAHYRQLSEERIDRCVGRLIVLCYWTLAAAIVLVLA